MNQYRRHFQRAESSKDRFVKRLGARTDLAGTTIRTLWEIARTHAAKSEIDSAFVRWCRANGCEIPQASDLSWRQHAAAQMPSRSDIETCKAWKRQWTWFDGQTARDSQLLLFCVQTYLSIVVRWTVWNELVSRRSDGSSCNHRPNIDRILTQSIHDDRAFREHGWKGFETDLFEWFLIDSRGSDFEFIAELLHAVLEACHAKKDDQDSEIDYFRPLYLDLVPRKVRHALGEYYTPGWLAEWVLDAVGYHGKPATRMLDPSCGSGTFLVAAVARWKTHHRSKIGEAWSQEGGPIVGIDTNPLAVICARANLLIALGEIPTRDGELFQFPVIHADSILGEDRNFGCEGLEAYSPDDNASQFSCSLPIGRFTHVAGNPPWVGWETLTHEYRERTTPLWKRYKLFVDEGMDTILGKGKKDLSMLMSYVVSDRYLADAGKLSFVITNSVFLNHGAGRGFRGLCLGPEDGDYVKIECVDDFSAVEPFENATTRASVFVWTKGRKTDYPLPYRRWEFREPADGIQNSRLNSTSSSALSCRSLVAQPCQKSDPQSSWIVAPPDRLDEFQCLLRPSSYRAYEGANSGGANGIYWLQCVESGPTITELDFEQAVTLSVCNRADLGKKETKTVETMIESRFLYPMVRGVQLRKWFAKSDTLLLLVQDPNTRRGIEPQRLRNEAPLTWEYLARFEEQLRSRAAFRKFFQRQSEDKAVDRAPFYSMFNVGPYTMSPFKVAWHRMKTPIEAAVLGSYGGRILMPQETHAFIPCEKEMEAHFLAAMLNSNTFNDIAEATAQPGGKSFGSPHLLERIHLPKYCEGNSIHRKIATIAMKIHESMAMGGDEVRLEALESSLEPLTESVFEDAAAARV